MLFLNQNLENTQEENIYIHLLGMQEACRRKFSGVCKQNVVLLFQLLPFLRNEEPTNKLRNSSYDFECSSPQFIIITSIFLYYFYLPCFYIYSLIFCSENKISLNCRENATFKINFRSIIYSRTIVRERQKNTVKIF